MKDAELFDLCKQVYEATAWMQTDKWWYKPGILNWRTDTAYAPLPDSFYIEQPNTYMPLYTSDYLLRKLEPLSERNLKLHYSVIGKVWKCQFEGYGSPKQGDTALEALLKLTLALHKEGLLK